MKKLLIILCLNFSSFLPSFAQQSILWDSLAFKMNLQPTTICNDTNNNVAYLYGGFNFVGNDTCNVIKMDSNGFTLLPLAPVYVSNHSTGAMYNNSFYLGGNRLAKFNGSTWDTMPGCYNIYDLYPYDGKLYACGRFDSIGNISANRIAYWNDTTWTAVPGLDTFLDLNSSWPTSLAWYKGKLYISGSLTKSNYTESLNLAMYDGQHWSDVGGQMQGNQGPFVNKMLVWNDTLYVCGSFRENNGAAGNGIAKWDGNNWHSLQSGLEYGDQPSVTDMMVFHDELYVAGYFYKINGMDYKIPGKFTGFAKWDGTKWCSMGTVANNVIMNLGQFRDTLYLMGVFDTLNNQPIAHIAKWIGGDYTDSCSQQPTGISLLSNNVADRLIIYPNPTKDLLNIQFNETSIFSKDGTIKITDVTGRLVQTLLLKLRIGDNHFIINTANFPSGMYFLEVNNMDGKYVAKFIKQ